MDVKELERQFSYRQLLGYNSKLKSDLLILRHDYNILVKYQEGIIEKEVKIRTKRLTDEIENIKNKHISEICEKDSQIEVLKKEVARLTSVLSNDASNSGIPTSKTMIGHRKYIPNSREKTDKKIGGQLGHKKHKLNKFNDDEITETVVVSPKTCPKCNSKNIKELETFKSKDETDYDVKVIKRRYKFNDCTCKDCNNYFHVPIPNELKEENQYGTTVQSLAVCLNNEIYTPFNKVVKLISGITNNEINISEGYIAKLQKMASENLEAFVNQAREYFPKQECYGWDDGVIDVNTQDATLRIYCTDTVSLFFAHEKRNKETIDEDGILSATTHNTTVMHDHYLYNYNDKFNYKNVECLSHILRRLKKMKNDTKHDWCDKLKKFLSDINYDRNKLLDENKEKFEKSYLEKISNEYDEIINKGYAEKDDIENYFKDEELTLLKDLKKYKKNYLLWCYNFKLPSTNNNCERNIRPVKSKMKISGHFKNITNARYYATIRSYIETCKRNGINIIDACARLMSDNPYSLDEILSYQKND